MLVLWLRDRLQGQLGWDGLEVGRSGAKWPRTPCPTHHCMQALPERAIGASRCPQLVGPRGRVSETVSGGDSRVSRGRVSSGEGGCVLLENCYTWRDM